MIDWGRIEGFDRDAGNEQKSSDKHGVSQAEAEQVFFNRPLLVSDDIKHSSSEMRFHALGRSNARRYLQVSFTLRDNDTRLRVISARPMSRKEALQYDQSTQADPRLQQ